MKKSIKTRLKKISMKKAMTKERDKAVMKIALQSPRKKATDKDILNWAKKYLREEWLDICDQNSQFALPTEPFATSFAGI